MSMSALPVVRQQDSAHSFTGLIHDVPFLSGCT